MGFFHKSFHIGWTEALLPSQFLLQYMGVRTQAMLWRKNYLCSFGIYDSHHYSAPEKQWWSPHLTTGELNHKQIKIKTRHSLWKPNRLFLTYFIYKMLTNKRTIPKYCLEKHFRHLESATYWKVNTKKTSWQKEHSYSVLQHSTGLSTSASYHTLETCLPEYKSSGKLETHAAPYAVSQNNRLEQTSRSSGPKLCPKEGQLGPGCSWPWSHWVLSVFKDGDFSASQHSCSCLPALTANFLHNTQTEFLLSQLVPLPLVLSLCTSKTPGLFPLYHPTGNRICWRQN